MLSWVTFVAWIKYSGVTFFCKDFTQKKICISNLFNDNLINQHRNKGLLDNMTFIWLC